MDKRNAFFTGGTGFIGGRLLRRLLELDRFDKIYVLIRRSIKNGVSTSADKRASLVFADIPKGMRRKVVILEGDVTFKECGISPKSLRGLKKEAGGSECFHAAADIRFGEENREEIFKTNYAGTENLLEVLGLVGVRRLHYLSTAYVCGDRKGMVKENELDMGQNFRNPYEESKFLAEQLVWKLTANKKFITTVYRPSIVVGDSVTGVTGSFAGYYAYMRGFSLLRREVIRSMDRQREQHHEEGIYLQNGDLHLPLTVWGNPEASINIVCIDYVVNLMIQLASVTQSAFSTFHIVNPSPPKAEWLLAAGLNALGITGVRLLDARDEIHSLKFIKGLITRTAIVDMLEKRINSNVHKYVDYSEVGPAFSMENVGHVLSGIPLHPAVEQGLIRRLIGYAADKNFGKNVKSG